MSVRDVTKSYGVVAAVSGVSLDMRPGEFVSLLGPSDRQDDLADDDCGFEMPNAGRFMSATDITHVAPNRRDIGMVFQRYALFPHLTVADIASPTHAKGTEG